MEFYHDVSINGNLDLFPVTINNTATAALLLSGNRVVQRTLGSMAFDSGSYIPLAQKGAANGVATLDAGGLLPSSQLPPLAITDTFVVASQAAMLALVAQRGDVAVRTDLNQTYILQAEPATTLGNWVLLRTPPSAVISVNGQTGVVSLDSDDILEGTTNLYYTAARARTAISAGTGISYNSTTGVITNTGAPATGGTGYIWNQTSVVQSLGQFWIDGSAIMADGIRVKQQGHPNGWVGFYSSVAVNGGGTPEWSFKGLTDGINTWFVFYNLSLGVFDVKAATSVVNFQQVPTIGGLTTTGIPVWYATNHPAGSALTPTLTGANVLASLVTNSAGHVTNATTRALTAADIGAAPLTFAPGYIWNQSGSVQESSSFWISGAGIMNRLGTFSAVAGTPGDIGFYEGTSAAGANLRWRFARTNAEGASSAGNDFNIQRADNTGVITGTPFSIIRSSGNVTMPGKVLVGNTSGTIGTSTGATNISRFFFYESDGTTQSGYVGKGSNANADIYVLSNSGNVNISPFNDLTATFTATMMETTGQGRFRGWYSANGTGPAAEIGYVAGQARIAGYDRTSPTYTPIALYGGTTATPTIFLVDGTGYQFPALLNVKSLGTNASGYLTDTTASFIANQTTLQALSNFNISGNGYIGGSAAVGTVAPTVKFEVLSSLAAIARFTGPRATFGMGLHMGTSTGAMELQSILWSTGTSAWVEGNTLRLNPVAGNVMVGSGGLVVEGLIQIQGGSPAAGKVLVSDASGNGSWQTLPGTQEYLTYQGLGWAGASASGTWNGSRVVYINGSTSATYGKLDISSGLTGGGFIDTNGVGSYRLIFRNATTKPLYIYGSANNYTIEYDGAGFVNGGGSVNNSIIIQGNTYVELALYDIVGGIYYLKVMAYMGTMTTGNA